MSAGDHGSPSPDDRGHYRVGVGVGTAVDHSGGRVPMVRPDSRQENAS
jgi:hypothetical protein